MRTLITALMVFIGTFACAQNSKLESIYNKIPPLPERLICENAKSYEDEMALLVSLMEQLDEIKYQLDEEIANNRVKTSNNIARGFPTEDELARVEKLPEAEQRAFWKKIENDQLKMQKTVETNKLKYQAEKEELGQIIAEIQNNSPGNIGTYLELYHNAGTVKSDKSQKRDINSSAKRQQQMEAICVEFCSTVAPVLLKTLKYDYEHMKQYMKIHRRLTVIEFAQYSTLSEEELIKQNAALLDLTDLKILEQFLKNYRDLYDVLPGEMENQRYD